MSMVATNVETMSPRSTLGPQLAPPSAQAPKWHQGAAATTTPQIPLPEIVQRLHSLGSYFWTRPETVNLVVIVTPAAQPQSTTTSPKNAQASLQSAPHTAFHASPLRRLEAPGKGSGLYERRTANRTVGGDAAPSASAADNGDARESPRRSSQASTSTLAESPLLADAPMPAQSYTPATSVAFTPESANAGASSQQVARNKELERLSQSLSEQRRASAPARSRQEPASHASTTRQPIHPRLTFRVHADYLTTQSSLFREVLSRPAIVSQEDAGQLASNNSPPVLGQSGAQLIHRPATPELLPAVILSLPDPSAFSAILHYLYFGDFAALANAMDSRLVRWEGVVANAEALGCDASFKRHLGRYWRNKVTLEKQTPSQAASPLPSHLSGGQGSNRDSFSAFSMAAMMARRTEPSQARAGAANEARARRPMSREKRPLSTDESSAHADGRGGSSGMGQLVVNNDGFAMPYAPSHAKHRRVSKELEPNAEGANVLSAMSKVRIAGNATKPQHGVAPHATPTLLGEKEQPRLGAALGRDRAYTWTPGRPVSQAPSFG